MIPSAETMSVVDARPHDHPVASPLDDGPEDEAHRDRRQQHEDPEERIAESVNVELDAVREHARQREFLRDPSEMSRAPGRR